MKLHVIFVDDAPLRHIGESVRKRIVTIQLTDTQISELQPKNGFCSCCKDEISECFIENEE